MFRTAHPILEVYRFVRVYCQESCWLGHRKHCEPGCGNRLSQASTVPQHILPKASWNESDISEHSNTFTFKISQMGRIRFETIDNDKTKHWLNSSKMHITNTSLVWHNFIRTTQHQQSNKKTEPYGEHTIPAKHHKSTDPESILLFSNNQSR